MPPAWMANPRTAHDRGCTEWHWIWDCQPHTSATPSVAVKPLQDIATVLNLHLQGALEQLQQTSPTVPAPISLQACLEGNCHLWPWVLCLPLHWKIYLAWRGWTWLPLMLWLPLHRHLRVRLCQNTPPHHPGQSLTLPTYSIKNSGHGQQLPQYAVSIPQGQSIWPAWWGELPELVWNANIARCQNEIQATEATKEVEVQHAAAIREAETHCEVTIKEAETHCEVAIKETETYCATQLTI